MTDAELNDLIMLLQINTPLVRLNHTEAVAVFEKLAELGYPLKKDA